MEKSTKRLITSKKAAAYLGISVTTLYKIEAAGELVPFRTPGGHRRYDPKILDEYLERTQSRAE